MAERRIVSVLFADLVGFTTLAEDRDPESTRELLTRYFDTAREAIDRHGGVVEKFIGDAVMAVWGAPVAHEDDAERAVRAGLELVDTVQRLAPEIQARAGVMTGEAAVTLGATNQGMVAGDLVNTAARLQGVADPGTVLVGEATRRAADRSIVFEPVGDHELKGKTTPVPAWRAMRVVGTRGGQQRADTLEPPFVGRDDELQLLKEQLHATGRDQRARLVSITGPGGIGKSRLVWELQKYVDGLTEPIYWHSGRSPSYGDGVAFWALGEMVRRRAGLAEGTDDATTRAAIATTVAEFVTDAAERELIEPALLALLGVDPSPTAGRDALFPAWRLFFERISEQGTTALVFEDLQWADTGLLDFIDHLLDWSKSRPLLVITLARPELFDRRPDWGAGHRTLTALALEPLRDEEIRRLLDGLVPGMPPDGLAAIVGRAEGMPLYAVETVRSLLADGRIQRDGDTFRPVGDLAGLSVPESLRSLIASRLDALDPADRALLQDASVLGQVFDASTLAGLTGAEVAEVEPRLRDLMRRELLEVESDPASPERGQYKFVQALIREVAYGTLALRDRRTRHLAAARHYESLGDDELAGALASHYLAAHEASAEGPEADAVAAQARIALRGAAERAAALGAHAQAVAHLDRALALTTDMAERGELLERAAQSANQAALKDAERLAREALAAREASGDPATSYRCAVLLGQILVDQSELDAAIELLEARAAQPAPEEALEADLQAALSRAYMRVGRGDESLTASERALSLAEPLNLERVVAEAMNNRAAVIQQRGRRREAVAIQEAAIRIAAEGGWTSLQLRLMNNLSVLLVDDDPARANETSREMRALARSVGSQLFYLMATANSSGVAFSEGRDWDEELAIVEDALQTATGEHGLKLQVSAVQMLSARGEPVDDRLRALEELRGATGDPNDDLYIDSAYANAALASGDFETSERYARAAMETATVVNEPVDIMQIGLAAIPAGDASKVRALSDLAAASPFQGMSARAYQAVLDGGALALEGRRPEAIARFGEAFETMNRTGMDFERAMWQLTAIRVLAGTPEADAWAADARAVFERVGARAFLDQLDSVAGTAPTAAPASADRVAPGDTAAALRQG